MSKRRETIDAWVFLLPNLIGFWCLPFSPLPFLFGSACTAGICLVRPLFVGLDNFRELIFNDPNFRRVLKNTLYFVVGVVPLGTAVSLALALLCNRALRGMTVFRTILYLPSVSSTIAVGIVWIWLLDPQFGGVINHLLRHVGFQTRPTGSVLSPGRSPL